MNRWITCLSLGLLSACNVSPELVKDQHAVMTNASKATRAELSEVIAGALETTNVMLAPGALTKTSTVTIERTPQQTLEGRVDSGRTLEKPEKFRLIKHGDGCVLLHEATGARYPLKKVECAAL